MNQSGKETELILQVVRGLRPLADLEEIGIQIRTQGNVHHVINPPDVVATIYLRDFAEGLLRQRADMEALRAWAKTLLIGDCVDLADEFEDEEAGDALLNALWDLHFDGILKDDVVRLAERILDGGSG
ncbi:MAG: hypothetical protein H0V86_14290 [Chloroflexia bacterium]|nr:hypothetical protein [Chloroflexia bacterium]